MRVESGDRMELSLVRNYERLESDFDILRDGSIVIPLDEYRNWEGEIELHTAQHRKVVGSVEINHGGFWSGNRTVWELGLTLRPVSRINLTLSYAHTDVSLAEGAFDTNLFQFEGNFDITPEVSLASILQYDDLSKILGMNHRFRWIIRPGSDFYVVYTQNWLRDAGDYRQLDRSSVMKANYTHRF